jgi:thiol:disulfide interchange protein
MNGRGVSRRRKLVRSFSRSSVRLAAILTTCLLAGASRDTCAQPERAVHWTAKARRASVSPGDTVRVALVGKVDEFFHLYSTTQGPGGPVRTTVEVLPSPHWSRVGALRAPPPDTIPDGNFGIMSEVYDDSVTLGLTLRLDPAAPLAAGRPRVAVRFQACTTRYCLPARTDTVVVVVSITGAPVSAAAPEPVVQAAAPPVEIATFGGASGVGAFLLLAASMGALALLTPCVFPMIPITVTSFLAVNDNRRRGITQASLYALGIVGGFTVLGVATSLVFGASGLARFSAHPVVNLAIAALFLMFALSLLNLVTIRLPFASSRLASIGMSSTNRIAGPLIMGVVFTVTAFTCTAPFVGSLLVLSSQGNWRWPFVGMLVFATVFAAPFFALALVPGLLRTRPRAGDWMPALETTVGAIEIAAAVKFLSNADMVLGWGLLTRPRVITLWILIFLALVIVLLRRARTAEGRSTFRLVASGGALALVALLVPGLFGRSLGELEAFLPPVQDTRANVARTGEPTWIMNDYRSALLVASREQRPILIDFTGYTCTNCRWMEANMFPRDEVKRGLDRYVRVRLYTDGMGEPYDSQQRLEEQLFGTVALPLYAVLEPDGRPRARFLGMTRDADEFISFLQRSADSR